MWLDVYYVCRLLLGSAIWRLPRWRRQLRFAFSWTDVTWGLPTTASHQVRQKRCNYCGWKCFFVFCYSHAALFWTKESYASAKIYSHKWMHTLSRAALSDDISVQEHVCESKFWTRFSSPPKVGWKIQPDGICSRACKCIQYGTGKGPGGQKKESWAVAEQYEHQCWVDGTERYGQNWNCDWKAGHIINWRVGVVVCTSTRGF